MKLKVFLSFVLAGALLLTAVPSAGASSNTAGEDLSKTGTTYEYIDPAQKYWNFVMTVGVVRISSVPQ